MKQKKFKMENEDAKKEEMKRQLEEDFLKLVEEGEDFRFYLYFSPDMLTQQVREILDRFLMEEAYNLIAAGRTTWYDFVVYDDPHLTVRLHTWEKKLEIKQKLLSHFEEKEEYEKCALITDFFSVMQEYEHTQEHNQEIQ